MATRCCIAKRGRSAQLRKAATAKATRLAKAGTKIKKSKPGTHHDAAFGAREKARASKAVARARKEARATRAAHIAADLNQLIKNNEAMDKALQRKGAAKKPRPRAAKKAGTKKAKCPCKT